MAILKTSIMCMKIFIQVFKKRGLKASLIKIKLKKYRTFNKLTKNYIKKLMIL